MVQKSVQTRKHIPMNVSSSGQINKANTFLGLIEYELIYIVYEVRNSLLGASHLVDYILVHIQWDRERYLPNIVKFGPIIVIQFCNLFQKPSI